MTEMHDAALRAGASGEHDWAEPEKSVRKIIESSLEIADLTEGPLGAGAIPYIWLDATYVKCRRDGRVASTAAVTAISRNESGGGACWAFPVFRNI